MNEPNQVHWMLDIETLGIKPGSVILEIAAYCFELEGDPEYGGWTNTFGITEYFVLYPNTTYQKMIGMTVDEKTLKWWKETNEKQLLSYSTKESSSPEKIISCFNLMKGSNFIWTKGNFDIPILEFFFERIAYQSPWHYRAPSDLRTVMKIANLLGWKDQVVRTGEAHSALEDCRHQIKQLKSAYQYLKRADNF
jgi:hypothetical protein